MRWTVHGERAVYDSPWLRVVLTDVDVPGHGRLEHHVVRMPAAASGTVVRDPARGVLLLWRHRFITDTWGWEIPAGRIEPEETPEQGARRETLEETGWAPGPLTHLTSYHPVNGLSDLCFHLFAATGARHIGAPSDPGEAERVEWVTEERVLSAARAGEIHDGLSLTGLLLALTGPPAAKSP